MTTLLGRVEAFKEMAETWEYNTERLGHYFEANGIGDESAGDKLKRRAILLSVRGSKVSKLMCDLLAPVKPGEKSYQDLVQLIQDNLALKPSEIVQRFKFNNRFRNEGESVADFVAALRNLADLRNCNINGNHYEKCGCAAGGEAVRGGKLGHYASR